jgi:hypothetical protein
MLKMGNNPTEFQRPSPKRPNAYTSGNEQQSELMPSAAPPRATPPRKAAPSRPAPARPSTPGPRKPKPGPGPTPPWPVTPTDNPVIPGAGPVMPQYDPMGNPTGPMAPPASGSSLGDPYVAPYTGAPPPMTGPGSDRMSAAVGPAQLGGMGSLPAGQSAASGLATLLGLGGGGGVPPPDVSGITPSVAYQPPMAPTQATPAGPGIGQPGAPMTGPGSDRALPPPGLLEQGGNWLRKNIPPIGF